jgi:hypothetical protein
VSDGNQGLSFMGYTIGLWLLVAGAVPLLAGLCCCLLPIPGSATEGK